MVLRPEGCAQISNLGTLLTHGVREAVNHWFIMCHRSRVDPYKATVHFGTVTAKYSGKFDFFRLGPMSGGFDEAAWAAKGLPLADDLAASHYG
jgi:hypothetical protein